MNYDHRYPTYRDWLRDDAVMPNEDPLVLTREVPPRDSAGAQQFFVFEPYGYPPAADAPPAATGPPWPEPGILRVVELVVSNGFDPASLGTTGPLANRATKPGFETQVHRWVFLSVAESSAVRCP